MMVQLKKYHLDFKKTIGYAKKFIGYGHTLSQELLKVIDFTKGNFFTLLPSGLPNTILYNFEYAGDLGWKNCKLPFDASLEGKKSIRELCRYIIEKAKKEDTLSWIFEDVNQSSLDPHIELFHSHGLGYEQEIYYLVNRESVSYDLVSDCIWQAGSVWRSLCVLTRTSFDYLADKKLSLKKIKEACVNVEVIVLGAYDMCGYIFWEKNRL